MYCTIHIQVTLVLPCRSKDEEIDLVSLDCFYKEAPLSISKPVSGKLSGLRPTHASCRFSVCELFSSLHGSVFESAH